MKLNLGCGADFRPGWLNVDCRRLYPDGPEFLCCDLGELDKPIEDGSVDEMVARNVLEYVAWPKLEEVLVAFMRKLRPRGVFSIEVPDGDALANAYVEERMSFHRVQRALFGAQNFSEETQRSLWTRAEAERRLQSVGLVIDRVEQDGYALRIWGRRSP